MLGVNSKYSVIRCEDGAETFRLPLEIGVTVLTVRVERTGHGIAIDLDKISL